jgi:hypothetical protein
MRCTRWLLALLVFGLCFPAESARAQADATATVAGNSGSSGQVSHHGPFAAGASVSADASNMFLSQGSSASAAADATAGTLRVYSIGRAINFTGNGPPSLPTANASVGDSVTVMGPGSSVNVGLTMAVAGYLASPGADSATSVTTTVQTAVAHIGIDNSSLGMAISRVWTRGTGGNPDQDVTSVGPSDPRILASGLATGNPMVTMTLQATVTVGTPIGLSADLAVATTDVAQDVTLIGDFGGTAHLSLQLPNGYTFTSHSGAFLARVGDPGLQLDGGDYPTGFPDAGATGSSGGTSGSSSGTGGSSGTSGSSGGTNGGHSGGCGYGRVGNGNDAPWAGGLLVGGVALLLLRIRRH